VSALDLFAGDFDLGVKSRGRDYFRRRKVRRLDAAPDGAITATVQSSAGGWYHVRLEYDEHGDPVYDCSCPHFQDHGGYPCKHLWAVLLQAEQEGVLTVPANAHGRPGDTALEESEVEEEETDESPGDRGDRSGGGNGNGFKNVNEEEEAEEDDDDSLPPSVPMPPPKRPAAARRPTGPNDDIGAAAKQVDWRKQIDRLGHTMRQYPQAARAGAGGASAAATAWAANRRILYVVDVTATLEGRGLVIELASQVVKRDGSGGERPRQLKIGREQVAALPDPVDRQILQMLLGAHRGDWGYYSYYDADVARRFVLPEAAYDTTFRLMCQTGRARLRKGKEDTADALAWDEGPPWEFWLEFKPSPGGRYQILDGSLRRNGMRMGLGDADLLLRGGLLFADHRVSRYDHRGAFDLVAELRDGMKLSVPLADRDDLLRKLLSLPRLPRIELPQDLQVQEIRPAMRPRLTVKRPARDADDRLIGVPSFDYGGQIVEAAQSAMAQLSGDGRQILYRDPDAEAAAVARLIEAGFRENVESAHGGDAGGPKRTLRLPLTKLPKAVGDLVADGWHVEAEGKIYRQAGQFKVQVKSGIDWFEMHGQVSFGDDLYAPLPRLLQALRRGERTVTLDDGTIGLLPEEWLKRYAPLASIADSESDHLRFTKSQVGFLDALLASVPEATFDETYTKALDQLMRFDGVAPLDPPESFVGELRAYQREGLGWMQFLRDFGFGGCLADDMGLGKTVQVLALLESRRRMRASGETPRPGPSLAVVPRSLVFNWAEEAKKFTPDLKVLDHTHAQRQKDAAGFEQFDLILTTYGTLRRDAAYFKDLRFDYVILDEAQAVKNAASESAKAVRLLNADHRLALSGTPVQNHLGELWSLLEFLNPGMMGAASVFKTTGAGGANVAPEARALLARAIRPFILRRTKEQVAKDLPAKLEQTIFCELEPAQRKLYDELRQHYRTSLLDRIAREGMNKAKIEVLEALLRLRQAACHPGLIDKARVGESSAKLETLLEHVTEVIEEGHKVLVFSQFTSLLAIVKAKFDEQKTVYEYLDGKTRDRQARVDRFQNDPDCKLFLISLKAGGLGLNLTRAEYVFLLDPWWNPAVEAQAIDRAHRIGQVNQVFAYRLIAKDTVEEKVLQLQQSKKDLADAIINADNSLIRTLGKEDLELLLS
jgi:superfamily II DNA or RNA helicase